MVKKVKIIISLLLASILVFTLSGCWNYIEIDQLFVVEGMAVDKDIDTGEYVLTYEIGKAKGGKDTELAVRVSTTRGETLFQAIRDAIHEIGSKLYWGHASICIIGKNVAEDGIVSIMDTIARATEIKPSILICYSEIENMEDLFNVEDPMHDSITQYMRNLFEEISSSGKFINAPMIDIIKNITGDSPAFLLSNFEIKEQGEKKSLIVNGSTAFVDDKYICNLDDIESRSINILKKEIEKHYIITLSNVAFPHASIEVINSKIKFDPIIENKKPRMKIELDMDCRLIEIEVAKDLNLENVNHGIKSSFEELLVQQLGSVIHRAQKNEKVDYIGFGKYFFTKHPDYWDTKPGTWNDVFETLDYEIKVNVEIVGRGSIREPLEIGH